MRKIIVSLSILSVLILSIGCSNKDETVGSSNTTTSLSFKGEDVVFSDNNGETFVVSNMDINEKSLKKEIDALSEEHNSLMIDLSKDYTEVFNELQDSTDELNDWSNRLNYIAPYLTGDDYFKMIKMSNDISAMKNLYESLLQIIVEEPVDEYYDAIDNYYEKNPEGTDPPKIEDYETVLKLSNEDEYNALIEKAKEQKGD